MLRKTKAETAQRDDSGPRGRYYVLEDGTRIPSVTTILKAVGGERIEKLIGWSGRVNRDAVLAVSADLYIDVAGAPPMSRMAWLATMQARLGKERANKKILAKACEIGSGVHQLIERHLREKIGEELGPAPIVHPEALPVFAKWETWASTVNLRPKRLEQMVWSRKHGFAGTLDCWLADVGDIETIIDWKTGKEVFIEAHLQNSAYRAAVREMKHGDPKRGLIVRIPKAIGEPALEIVEALPETECFEVFLAVKTVWEFLEKHEAEKESGTAPAEAMTPETKASAA